MSSDEVLAEDQFRHVSTRLVPNIVLMWYEQEVVAESFRTFRKRNEQLLKNRKFALSTATRIENEVRNWVIARANNGIGTSRH